MARLIDADALEAFVKTVRQVLYLDKTPSDMLSRESMLLNFQQYIHLQPTIDAVPVVRGEWVDDENGTEWISHQCSVCKESSLSEMIYEDDYDEGLDGEWFYLGKREIGIIEHLTNYCPNCGAKMDGERRNDDA